MMGDPRLVCRDGLTIPDRTLVGRQLNGCRFGIFIGGGQQLRRPMRLGDGIM